MGDRKIDIIQTNKNKNFNNITALNSNKINPYKHPSKDKRKVVVACIPAYNEAGNIGTIILRTQPFVDEIIVCDDGSVDLTGKIAERLGATVIYNSSNLGKGASLRKALNLASTLNPDIVVMLDADGQHEPESIPQLIKPIIFDDTDLVIGSRFTSENETEMPLLRRFGIKIIDIFLGQLISKEIKDTQSGYRVISNNALSVLSKTSSDGYGQDSEMLILAKENGLSVKEVPVNIRYDGIVRPSKKNPFLHGLEVIGSIIKIILDEYPLLIMGGPGVTLVIIGIVLASRLQYKLISVGLTLAGTILFVTSLILYSNNMSKRNVLRQ